VSRRLTIALAAVALGTSAACEAQVRASEQGSVSQTIDGTVITVEYYRPSLRGRTPFGGVVHWGEKWTPGANWATTFEASKDLFLNGRPLPKGKYSVWMIPQQAKEWSVILHRDARRFHMQRPSDDGEVLRLAVAPEQGPSAETLIWSFPAVQSDGAVLRMQWGTTIVPLHVRVEPSKPRTLTAAERAAYVGRYRMPRPNGSERLIEVMETDDGVRGRMTPPRFAGFDADFDMIPLGDHRFRMGLRQGGKYFDAEEVYFQFTVENGKATAIEMPNVVMGGGSGPRGVRVP
jgi:hypothetical protein